MGGKRPGCLRRLSAGAVTIPYREKQRDRESINAIFKVLLTLLYKSAGNIMFPDVIIEVTAIACSSSVITDVLSTIHAIVSSTFSQVLFSKFIEATC